MQMTIKKGLQYNDQNNICHLTIKVVNSQLNGDVWTIRKKFNF